MQGWIHVILLSSTATISTAFLPPLSYSSSANLQQKRPIRARVVFLRNQQLHIFVTTHRPRRRQPHRVFFVSSNQDQDTVDGKDDDEPRYEVLIQNNNNNGTNNDEDDNGDFEEWQMGNVYEHLAQLEQAITLANAEQNLLALERINILNAFAKQRRLLRPDVLRHVVAPFVLSLWLTLLFRYWPLGQNSWTKRWLCNLMMLLSGTIFWAFTVTAPIVLLCMKQMAPSRPTPRPSTRMISNEPSPKMEQLLDPEYLRIPSTRDWEDPSTPCRDYTLYLLEWWVSAVASMALVGVLTFLIPLVSSSTPPPSSSSLQTLLRYMARIMTRIGAVAALYQYPKLMYDLQRPQQPRPMELYPILMQPLVRTVVSTVPWALAVDMCIMTQGLPSVPAILGIYTAAGSAVFAFMWKSIRRLPKTQVATAVTTTSAAGASTPESDRRLSLLGRVIAVILSYVIVGRIRKLSIGQTVASQNAYRLVSELQKSFQQHGSMQAVIGLLMIYGALSFSIVIPLAHVVVFKQIFRIQLTHDLSLAMDPDERVAILQDPDQRQPHLKWRYRLEWRSPPQRLVPTLRQAARKLWHNLFVAGNVEEQLIQLREKIRRDGMKRRGSTIWQRLERDERLQRPRQQSNAEEPSPARVDRSQWKINSMKQIAAKNQRDYERNVFEDPLGVAVQQTFGIGLSFGFDHERKLKPGETPSTRRLQARAAKSAIKRAQEIYDAATSKQMLDGIDVPAKRKIKAAELRKQSNEEMQYLATRLSELIPTNPCPTDVNSKPTKVEQFTKNEYVRTSKNELVIKQPKLGFGSVQVGVGSANESPSILFLLERYRQSQPQTSRVEFVEEWLKQNQNWTSTYDNSTHFGVKTELV